MGRTGLSLLLAHWIIQMTKLDLVRSSNPFELPHGKGEDRKEFDSTNAIATEIILAVD